MREALTAAGLVLCGFVLGGVAMWRQQRESAGRDAIACLDTAAQSEAACNAVAERIGITVTIPPWQAMVLTPILDPR